MTIAEIFNEQLISALQSGMSYKEFWEDDPEIFWAYRFYFYKKMENEREEFLEKTNVQSWLNGMYVHHAVSISLFNAFREKGVQSENYLSEPLDLFGANEEKEKEKIESAKKAQELKIKERALQIQKMLQDNKK